MYCLIHMSEGKFTFTLCKANIPPNLLLLHWCLTSWEMVMWGKSNIFSEEPALKTFKWGNTFRFIFQVQFLECLSDESSNQKQRAGLSNLAEVTALGSLQSCVPVESWGISLVSQPSTEHSLLIYQSLPPSRLSQLQLGPCDCCLSHLTLRWLALMSLSTRKSRAPSLNRAEGDYATASPRGWNNF